MRRHARLSFITATLALCSLFVGQAYAQQTSPSYTVWAADQNANTLDVLDPDGKVLKTIDGATLGDAKRPHMLWGVPKDEYIYSANTVSNSITVLGHKDGGVKAIIANVGKSPDAAQPNPQHPDRIYVSNIAPQAAGPDGKPDRGETITELVRTGGPKWEIARFLDLKAAPAPSDANLYPSRRPVCVGFSRMAVYMLATLFNGGLAVVDLQTWNVVKGWGKNDIAENGCGLRPLPRATNCTSQPGISRHHGCMCSTSPENPNSSRRIISQSLGRTRTRYRGFGQQHAVDCAPRQQ